MTLDGEISRSPLAQPTNSCNNRSADTPPVSACGDPLRPPRSSPWRGGPPFLCLLGLRPSLRPIHSGVSPGGPSPPDPPRCLLLQFQRGWVFASGAARPGDRGRGSGASRPSLGCVVRRETSVAEWAGGWGDRLVRLVGGCSVFGVRWAMWGVVGPNGVRVRRVVAHSGLCGEMKTLSWRSCLFPPLAA